MSDMDEKKLNETIHRVSEFLDFPEMMKEVSKECSAAKVLENQIGDGKREK